MSGERPQPNVRAESLERYVTKALESASTGKPKRPLRESLGEAKFQAYLGYVQAKVSDQDRSTSSWGSVWEREKIARDAGLGTRMMAGADRRVRRIYEGWLDSRRSGSRDWGYNSPTTGDPIRYLGEEPHRYSESR